MPYRNWKFRIDDIIEVIGEAASHFPVEIQEQYEDVPWSMMKGIRNVVAHEYFGVDLEIVWKTVNKDLPVLKDLLRKYFFPISYPDTKFTEDWVF